MYVGPTVDPATLAPTGLHQYMLIASWSKTIPNGMTLTCYEFTYPPQDVVVEGGLASDGTNRPTTNGERVQGSHASPQGNGNFTWNLSAAQ